MLLGKANNVLIVSPYEWSDIADELQIANNVLNNWNKKHANNRKRFFFFNIISPLTSAKNDDVKNSDVENSDLLIVLFLTKSGIPIKNTNNEFIKKCIQDRVAKEKRDLEKPTLVYFIEKNAEEYSLDNSLKNDIMQTAENSPKLRYEQCNEKDFEFDLTCDICAFDNFNNTISIEFEMVNIKVEKENNKYHFIYLATLLVDSLERPIKYRDRISTHSGTIKPDFKLIKDGDYICDPPEIDDNKQLNYIEYEVKPTPEKEKDELFFTGKIEIVDRTENWFGLHIPYNAKYLIINVDVSQINMETVSAELEGEKNFKKLYDEKNKTYIFKTENVRKDSDIIFKLEQKNDK